MSAEEPGKKKSPAVIILIVLVIVLLILIVWRLCGCSRETPPSSAKPAAASRESADAVIVLTDETFAGEVLQSDIPVLVDFWAPWCGPCRRAAPVIEKIAQEYKGKLKVCKLNVDKAGKTAGKYGVRSIPTLKIFKNGQAVDQMVGVSRNFESDLKKKLEPHLK